MKSQYDAQYSAERALRLFSFGGKNTFSAILVAWCCFQGTSVFAQPIIPPTVAPGQIEQRFVEPRRPEVKPEPVVPRPSDPAPLADGKPLFTLSAVQIDGATVYGVPDLVKLHVEFLSKVVSQRDLNEIARRITAKYRADGYVLSQAIVPVQEIKAGVVRIRVIEGFIDGIRIEGATRGNNDILSRYLEKIRNSRPLRAADLERYLLLINDLPGVAARVLVTPSPTVPGASDLALLIQQNINDAFVSLDNRGTRYNGPYQIQLGGSLNSLQSRTRIRGIATSQFEELRYGELAHDLLIGDEGTNLAFSVRRTLSEPGYTLAPLEFKSNSTSGDVILSHPVVRARRENLRVSGTFSFLDSETTVLGTEFSRDRLSVIRVGAAYDFVDRFFGINQFDFELSRGLNIFGTTETGSSGLSRINGHSNFTKGRFQAARLQRLADSWDLLAGVSGQIANNPLLVSEEFAVGGSNYGRAYDSSEITGDDGASAKLELRYAIPLQSEAIYSSQLFGFYDIGRIRNQEPVAGEFRRASLASAGIGTRFSLRDGVTASIEIDFPLTRPVAALGNTNPRIFFSLVKSISKGLAL